MTVFSSTHMWLLSTDRAELKYFPSVEKAALEGYAILSHVWDETEQTFQETQALRDECAALPGCNPRDRSSLKVRKCCELAESHGFKWLWDDTCCIDKTSSADLSEAINSMFAYYSHAEVCYAYLKDVHPLSDGRVTRLGKFQFRRSQWFRRGWTLQELLAPPVVIFLTLDWTIFGTKANRASVISEITGIPEDVLLRKKKISAMSIACRMSLAADRQTTRLEDEAYCLLGIFDIHMAPLYGEGRNAFRRLQEEIMKKGVDRSLFSWDHGRVRRRSYTELLVRRRPGVTAPSGFTDDSLPEGLVTASSGFTGDTFPEGSVTAPSGFTDDSLPEGLFAPSPLFFKSCRDVSYRHDTLSQMYDSRKPPQHSVSHRLACYTTVAQYACSLLVWP